jgi:hypothetical protein
MGKRFFRVVPPSIVAKKDKLVATDISVGCLLRLTPAQILEGRLRHLGIETPAQLSQIGILPNPSQGRIAKKNLNGWTILRRDLPRVQKTFIFYAPNFGDYSKGEHAVYQTRTIYQRDEYLPPSLTISTKVIEEASGVDRVFFIRAQIDQPIDKRSDSDLVFALSLCQESFGDCDVFEPDAGDADFLRARIVDWEILPTGHKDIVERLLSPIPGERKPLEFDKDRADFFRQVEPDNYVKGTSGFTRYVGMLFGNILLLENLSAGNAIYVIRGDWESLSKLPKMELMKLKSSDVWRVVHNPGWQVRVKALVKELAGREI